MPYGKSKTAVKTYQKKKQGATKIAQKALKIAKATRTYSFVDYTINDTMTGSLTPEKQFLSPPNTDGERQTIQDIECFVKITHDIGSAGIVDWRMDLVLDRQPSKVTLDFADCYESATPETTALLSFNNRERYKICKSYTGYLDNDVATERIIHFKYRSGLVCEADGTVYSQANILKNAYYLVYWSNSTANHPSIVGTVRVTTLLT